MTFSAVVFLVSFLIHSLPSASDAHAVLPPSSHRLLRPKLISGQEVAGPETELIRDGASTKRPRRRHQVSRKSGRKAKKTSQTRREVAPERLHVALNDDLTLHGRVGATGSRGNSSDVIDTYEYDDIPGIWEISRRLRNRGGGKDDDGSPPWQRLPTAEEISRFKTLVQQTLACRQLPALTLALVKKGRVLLTASLGHADPELHVPVSRSTRFAIGSLTKAFTATLVSEVLMRRK